MTPAGRILLWSPAAATMFGRTAAQTVGQDAGQILLAEQHRTALDSAVRSAATGVTCAHVLPARLGDGRTVPIGFRCEPMTDAEGRVTVAISAAADEGQLAVLRAESSLSDSALLRIGATLDLRQTAWELADVLARCCGAAVGVYVLERLLVDDQAPSLQDGESRVVVRRMALRVVGTPRRSWTTAFPADEVVAYASGSPIARCMSTRRPVIFGRSELDAQTLRRLRDRLPAPSHFAEILSYENFLAVPLIARGEVLGFVVLGRRPTETPFAWREADFVGRLADHAANCMDNGRLYDRERRTAATLQRSLLPVDLATPPGMRIAHRYLPAGTTSRIGGDWYDTIPLPGGRVALVVGDAMGHGTAAALVMGQLRTAIRILARLGLPPAELLGQLDQIAQELTTAQFATCLFAVCDPVRRVVTMARAGHVPPVIAHADGTSAVIDLPAGLPLGVAQAEYEAAEVGVPEGSTLVFCTDGLVENRDRDVETGLAILRATLLTNDAADVEAACDAILKNLHSDSGTDDATLLLARIEPDSGPVAGPAA